MKTEAWAVYLRVSSEDKQHPERSIPRQRRKIQSVLLDNCPLPVYREYTDFISGKIVDRSNYRRLLADARAGLFSHLALAEGARFGRDLEEWIAATRELIELGVKLKPADMPSLDVDTPDGFFIAVVMGGLAEREVRVMGERIQDGMKEKLLKGGWPFLAPDGYLNKKKEVSPNKWERWVEPDPERGPLITLLFDLYATRQYTLQTLADEMNRQGHRLPNGQPWTMQTVHRRLVNHLYVGRVVSKLWEVDMEGIHQPLVEKETWNIVQQILQERGEPKRDGVRFRRGRGRIYPLVGLLWSEETGSPFYGTTCKGERCDWTAYYRTKVEHEGKCIYVQAEVVHRQIPPLLSEIRITDEVAAALHQLYRQEIDAEVEKWLSEGEPAKLRQRVAELESEQQTLLRFALRELVTEGEYAKEKARIAGHLARIRAKLATIENRGQQVAYLLDQKLVLLGIILESWGKAGPSQKRVLGGEIFEKIVVDKKGAINEINWTPDVEYLLFVTKRFDLSPVTSTLFSSVEPLLANLFARLYAEELEVVHLADD